MTMAPEHQVQHVIRPRTVRRPTMADSFEWCQVCNVTRELVATQYDPESESLTLWFSCGHMEAV